MFSHVVAMVLFTQAAGQPPQSTPTSPMPTDNTAPAMTAPPATPTPPPPVPDKVSKEHDFQMSFATLNRLHVDGLVNDATYNAALKDLIEVGMQAGASPALTAGGFSAIMYGFVEADAIFDTTQSFTEVPGMGLVAREGTYANANGRTIFTIRNSRLGFRIGAPKFGDFTASGIIETDFLGNQPANPPANAQTLTPAANGSIYTGPIGGGYREGPYWTNPTLRARHVLGKLESPYFNFWFGQTWALVGWQPYFQPNTVQIQGVPGELYSRTPQFRLSHDFDLSGAKLGIAVAALRPPQMDAQVPDFQGAIKFSLDDWKGVQTIGSTGTNITSAALSVSGAIRQYKLPGTAPTTSSTTSYNATGLLAAADLLIPVLPAKERHEWAITLLAEGTIGTGAADQFTGLTGGAGVGSPPGYAGAAPYSTVADVDPGLVGWSNKVTDPTLISTALQTVDWETAIVNLQIYLPPEGKVWLSGTFSTSYSDNVLNFGGAKAVTNHIDFYEAALWADVVPGIRMALSFDHTRDTYGDGMIPSNNGVQYSAYFIF
jgi:hypothetical protein